ncbi:hypothetical protein CVM73_20115 [Bradyrhizobium forestalis]|uniref:Uncharacterized protein n=1 Tax=Bradyrhizobium forestalis TaxID=1419263 RepID=A0A2M8R6P8_9BRAD|nr:hypothetical protein CVM73_20115 [Bradyrhizobium forestalis]
MKLQPSKHGLARPAWYDVEGVSVDARLVVHAPVRTAVMQLPAADPLYLLRIIHVALLLPKMVKAFRRRLQGAVPARGVGGELVGWLGRVPVPMVRPHAGNACVGKCIASRCSQRIIAS